jgi:hypothetical protein
VKDGAITSSKIAAGAVTSAAIANGVVTPEKLAATDAFTITNIGEIFAKTVITGESPRVLAGSLTISRATGVDAAGDIIIVEAPALEWSGSPANLSVSRLVARRALTSNAFWLNWFQQTAAMPPQYASVTLTFTNGPVVLMQNAIPTGYAVERGADGIYYETLTLKPTTYQQQ